MTETKYPHVVQAVMGTPWAILPEKLAAIVEVIAIRASGATLSDEEIRERIGAGPADRQPATAGAVAVLPLYGVIVPRANMFSDVSGGTSVQRFSEAFRAALANPQVGSILIDVDSPGGSTDLITELAAEIHDAGGIKPIVAIANTLAASAGYWIASQADELIVTPSGEVGGIGVIAAHDDVSALQERLGVKTTLVTAGKHKGEFSPFQPLSDEARDELQRRVDEFYGLFVADVARGRGVSEAAVRGGFGEGRLVGADDAVRLGMADRVDTFEATVQRLIRGSATGGVTARSVRLAGSELELSAGPIRPHSTDVVDEPWDGPMMVSRCPAERKPLRALHAWADDDADPDTKMAYKFPHHQVSEDGEVGAANVNGVRNGLSRVPQADIPEADEDGVRQHLEKHLDDFNRGRESSVAGVSFTGEAEAVRDAAGRLVNRARSLAEVRRGRLTAAKREQLSACAEALRGSAAALAELLAETDPTTAAGLREVARFMRLKLTS